MSGEYSRLAIWGLDNLLGLESLSELLSKNYNYPIDFLEDEQLDEKDKTLYNNWVGPFEIKEMTILGENIKYLNALANYEYGYGEGKSFVNDELLPRKVRVFNHTTNVLFFEYEKMLYCVVETSESQETRLRSALFGQRRGRKMVEWGTVSFNQPAPFTFSSKFYYWLLSKKGNEFLLNGEKATILDVSAISLLSERNVYDSQSTGPNLLGGSVSALSGLGTNENIYLVGLKIKINDVTLDLRFGSNGVTYVNKTHCYMIDGNKHEIFDSNPDYFILLIFEFIFTELLKQYDQALSSRQWDATREAELRKNWSLKVIRELVDQNSIELEDIKTIFPTLSGVTLSKTSSL